MIYLGLAELLHVGERATGSEVMIRDVGLLGINGRRLTLTNDEACDLVMSIAGGDVDDIAVIAEQIRRASRQR